MVRRTGALALLLLLLSLGPQLGRLGAPPHGSVTLALAGDVMLGRGVAQAHVTGDWETALEGLAPVFYSADLALANLESPLAPAGRALALPGENPGGYNLCAPSEALQALVSAGIDVLALANNHSLDCTPDGLAATAAALRGAGLLPLLPGQPMVLEIQGIRVALLAFDDVSAPLDTAASAAKVRAAARDGALVIVSLHWGAEYHAGPSRRQLAVARALVDAGASLVWGHHPHVLQPLAGFVPASAGPGEGHDGPPFAPPALVVYSLGNLLFDQVSPPDVRRSALLLVTLEARGVRSVSVVPIRVDPLTGTASLAGREDAAAVQRRLQPENSR